MSGQPKGELQQELVALTRAPERPPKSKSPLNYLKGYCPTLLARTADALALIGVTDADVEDVVKVLLREVVLKAEKMEVQQAGDLLGLPLAPADTLDAEIHKVDDIEARRIFENYKTRSDAPKDYYRYGMQVRQVIAAHRNGLGFTRNSSDEPEWMQDFVDELCTYLDDDNGKLTAFVRTLGLLTLATAALDGVEPTLHKASASLPSTTRSQPSHYPRPQARNSITSKPDQVPLEVEVSPASTLPEQTDPAEPLAAEPSTPTIPNRDSPTVVQKSSPRRRSSLLLPRRTMRRIGIALAMFEAISMASIPVGAFVLPPFRLLSLQVVDIIVTSEPGIALLFIMGLLLSISNLIWLSLGKKAKIAAAISSFLVPTLALLNIAPRIGDYGDQTLFSTSMHKEVKSWQPVVLDDSDTFEKYSRCDEPPGEGERYTSSGYVHKFEGVYPGDPKPIPDGYYPFDVDNGFESGEYNCSTANGSLRTELSSGNEKIVVYRGGGGKDKLTWGDYYAETLVRPMGDNRLSSCLIVIARYSEFASSLFYVQELDDSPVGPTYVAKMTTTVSVQTSHDVKLYQPPVLYTSEPLPFIHRNTIPGEDYSSWTKLAIYKKGSEVKLLVNDRVAIAFDEVPFTMWADERSIKSEPFYPQLATRAGRGIRGGVAACEFDYFKVYTPQQAQ